MMKASGEKTSGWRAIARQPTGTLAAAGVFILPFYK